MSTCEAASQQTSLLGDAVTYFLTRHYSIVFGGVNMLKTVYWRTFNGRFHHKTQLNDALNDSYPALRFCQFPLSS